MDVFYFEKPLSSNLLSSVLILSSYSVSANILAYLLICCKFARLPLSYEKLDSDFWIESGTRCCYGDELVFIFIFYPFYEFAFDSITSERSMLFPFGISQAIGICAVLALILGSIYSSSFEDNVDFKALSI